MFTSTVWADDSQLLQESNLTARQPCRAPITLYISFNKHHRLVNERLVTLRGCRVCVTSGIRTRFASSNIPDVSHYSSPPHNSSAIVIVNSKLIKRHSKAKRRAPAYSGALRQFRGVFQTIVRGTLRSGCQRVRGGRLGDKAGVV